MARRRSTPIQRLPTPPGWTSKGEIIREDREGRRVVPPVFETGGSFIMPKKDTQPVDEIVARGADDVALKLGNGMTRDALVDPREGDYIPDNEEKGYHVGEVRQPAEPVLTRSGAVRYESVDSPGPSKFESPQDQKARSNAREAGSPDLYGGNVHVPISVDLGDIGALGSAERLRARGITVTDTRSKSAPKSTASKLEDDANAVASEQAAEDAK
jgi:hypothetical protein